MTSTRYLIICGSVLMALLLCAGCIGSCTQVPDANIRAAVKDKQAVATGLGMSRHHNITFSINNAGDRAAKSVRVETAYCNDLTVDRTCENRTFDLGEMAANETLIRSFEYDRNVMKDAMDGTYDLSYTASSCP